MNQWVKPDPDDPNFDEVVEFEPPVLTVEMSDNPVVAELYGPHGEVLRQWVEREPIGYRKR